MVICKHEFDMVDDPCVKCGKTESERRTEIKDILRIILTRLDTIEAILQQYGFT